VNLKKKKRNVKIAQMNGMKIVDNDAFRVKPKTKDDAEIEDEQPTVVETGDDDESIYELRLNKAKRKNNGTWKQIGALTENSLPKRDKVSLNLVKDIKVEDEDLEVPRSKTQANVIVTQNDEELVVPRKGEDRDLNVDRKPKDSETDRNRKIREREDDEDLNIPRKKQRTDLMEGGRAGLYTAEELIQEELEKKRKELAQLRSIGAKKLGKDAPTIYRDKRGRKLEMLNQMVNQEQGILKKDEEADMQWGVGQKEEKKRKLSN